VEINFGKVSVVHMAFAVASHASCELSRFLNAVGIFERIFLIGKRCPITPVDMTIELLPIPSSGEEDCWKQAEAVSSMETASSMPPLPVTALAHPELTMIDRTPAPPRLSSILLLTCTGAAWNLLVVKTAAAYEGVSDTTKARSAFFVLDGFTPTCVPETRNPFGYVPDVGTYLSLLPGMEESIGAE
jgi:hypothetical protein